MNDELLLYQLSITQIPGVGTKLAKHLINQCGSVEQVFKEKLNALAAIDGISANTARNIYSFRNFKSAEDEIQFILKNNIETRFFNEADFPFRLRFCSDAPILLFGKGNINWNPTRALSVVGTRRISSYGKKQCANIIKELSPTHASIISGLAYGVDINAHRASLQYNLPTIAIVAHGLDRIYPSVHRNTLIKMLDQGGIISEFWSGTNPDRENFPKRNRIIAGLSDATLVIESGEKGGSMITADIAASYNRDVFALPGNIGSEMSAGCNYLIHTQKATLTRSAADIQKIMNWGEKKRIQKGQISLFNELEGDEKTIISYLHKKGQSSIDEICIYTQISMSSTAVTLLNLEFKGMIESLPGKIFRLIT